VAAAPRRTGAPADGTDAAAGDAAATRAGDRAAAGRASAARFSGRGAGAAETGGGPTCADGAVQGARLARSAGHPLLDAEIEAMLRRVGKLPPPPQGRPLALTAPVTFRLD